MKIKSRLILATTSLLVLSGVAAGTSTYAWYTANRQVELGISNISAQAQLTTLQMTYEYAQNGRNGNDAAGTDGTDPFVVDGTSKQSAIVGSFTKTLTDVSSEGDGSYLKPIFGANVDDGAVGFWNDEAEYVASPNADNDVFYHELVFTFTLTGDQSVALYLSPNSTITENTSDADNNLTVADAVRFSVSSMDASDVKTEKIYANPNGDSESNYLADSTDFDEDSILPGNFGILEKSDFFAKANNYTEAELCTGDGEPGSLTKYNDFTTGYITEVADPTEGTTFNIAVDIWIEGTDADCTDAIDSDYFGLFDMNLEFYSLNIGGMTHTE